jgi:hypothetical protein
MQQCIHVKSVGGRARNRLDGRLRGLVRGEAFRYRERLDRNPRLEELRRRFLVGESVDLADVFDAAGLTVGERHVLRERLPRPDGAVRSHGQIAADRVMRKPDGTTYTRQQVEQIERTARRKLGLGRSIAAAVHAAERAGRALALRAGGRAVHPDELREPGRARRRRRRARWEVEHEAVSPGELRGPLRARLRRRKARWEVEHEAAVRAFLRSRA